MEGWPDDAKETMTKVAKIIGDAVNSAPCPSCALKDARIKELEDMYANMGQEKDLRTFDCERYKSRIAKLEKVAEAAEAIWETSEYAHEDEALRAGLAALKEPT